VNPTHPRALLAQRGLRPKKRFGQNFLTDPQAARRIARLCLEAPTPPNILEIGAGTGTLTEALLEEGAAVTAIEIDSDLVELLRSREPLQRARILNADALTFDYQEWAGGERWGVTGNLPYNIATPLILQFAEMERGPETVTVMIQKDVAERITAKPGSAAYGSLTLAVQYAMDVRRAFTLGPRSFFPPPKVHSTVVQMRRRAEPRVRPRDLQLFWKVVRGAFAYRRKTLLNSLVLALGFDRARIERALTRSHLSPEQRGERLDFDAFASLADALAER
jgi:16S rRNA (adenine1518-N6/adenine1519-N6)-dimethyltransferase